MITQWKLFISPIPEHPLHPDSAYRLYAFLLDQLSAENAACLHDANGGALSQFLYFAREKGMYVWTINLFHPEIAEILSPVLAQLTTVNIEGVSLDVAGKDCREVRAEELIAAGREKSFVKSIWYFSTPASFRQSGRYVIFPQEKLLLQSLVNRWNEVFPEYPLNDEDAFQALLSGIHIVDYQLRTTRFPLKGSKLPSFTGNCVLEAKLPLPLLELWTTIARFAEYAGVGMKTGLGMGGTQVVCGDKKQ